MNIKNLRIDRRLGFGAVLLLLLLGIISGFGNWRLQQVGDAAEAMAKRALVKERITAQWQVAEAGKTMDEIVGSVRRVPTLSASHARPAEQGG
ncbi:MAG: hypothetical protein H7238_05030 [Polaromonas sp.]|nr:hypothetical protein [Polaromonas sp.]